MSKDFFQDRPLRPPRPIVDYQTVHISEVGWHITMGWRPVDGNGPDEDSMYRLEWSDDEPVKN